MCFSAVRNVMEGTPPTVYLCLVCGTFHCLYVRTHVCVRQNERTIEAHKNDKNNTRGSFGLRALYFYDSVACNLQGEQ